MLAHGPQSMLKAVAIENKADTLIKMKKFKDAEEELSRVQQLYKENEISIYD